MSDTSRNAVVTFRCTAEMAEDLAKLGGDSDNSRSNIVYILLCTALYNPGGMAEQISVLREKA